MYFVGNLVTEIYIFKKFSSICVWLERVFSLPTRLIFPLSSVIPFVRLTILVRTPICLQYILVRTQTCLQDMLVRTPTCLQYILVWTPTSLIYIWIKRLNFYSNSFRNSSKWSNTELFCNYHLLNMQNLYFSLKTYSDKQKLWNRKTTFDSNYE